MFQFPFTLLLIVLPGLGLSQSQELLSTHDIRKDVMALRTALEKHHPGLYWYTSKQEFESAWDSLDQELDHPLSELEFFKLLLPVVAKVKCAHTLFYPSRSMMATGTRFPIDVKLIGDKLYLMPDSTAYSIPHGSELIAINERPASVVLQLLLPNLQAQGGNAGWKKVILENDFQNYYYYIVEQTDQFLVKYRDFHTGREETKVVDGSRNDVLSKHWKNWYPATDGPPLDIQFNDSSDIAILTIKSFVRARAKSYKQDFDKLIADYFNEIKKKGIRKLIIDVRGNEGGNNPEKLYAYIARPSDSGRRNYPAFSPDKTPFHGSVIVLANERSISAQETFVSIFKYHQRGLVIGRSTPGCFKGLCGGKKHKLILPNSKFEIYIPMHLSNGIHASSTELKPGEGFPPDVYVEEKIVDIVQELDATMMYAIELIEKSSRIRRSKRPSVYLKAISK